MNTESPRKLKIERDLKEMNNLLMIMIQTPDNSVEYQKNIIFLLRAIASIRERMLANETEDATIKEEIRRLEEQARSFLLSKSHGVDSLAKKCNEPCKGPQA